MGTKRFISVLGLILFSNTFMGCGEGAIETASASAESSQSVPAQGVDNGVGNTEYVGPTGPGGITASGITFWANDGGDKVSRDELRASNGGTVTNAVWDGTKVILWGAKNETVSFNAVLESKAVATANVSISFNQLTGPGGAQISSSSATGNQVFNYVGRNIEQFYVRYLQIKGLSKLSYEVYDERHIPKRFQRPWTADGRGTGTWNDRPDHDKYYPEIAVPMEAVGTFNIAANQNQSVWTDVYIPKTAAAGVYTGNILVKKAGVTVHTIPVQLTVKNFTLPDVPNSKTMVNLGYADIGKRYVNNTSPSPGTADDTKLKLVRDRHYQMAHRHKISLIDANSGSTVNPGDRPRDEWFARLDGTLFTSANGYAGVGAGTGNGVFSVGTYGTWSWKNQGEAGMHLHTDAWENWFLANSPDTERFLYLIDESSDYPQTEEWALWALNNPGVGKNLKTFATIPLPRAVANVPSLMIAASWFTVGDTTLWNNSIATHKSNAGRKLYIYNGKRPSNGSFATDDDGIALRELAWAQYKKNIDRWFFWESTYYNDYQGGRGQNNVFQTAATFSGAFTQSATVGETGYNHSNGDGVLFYPGTDRVFTADSYNLDGPIASLRLKQWRRGIQDIDYVALAKAVNPTATQAVVDRMVPKALWDYGIANPADPTYVRTDISWSTNPDDWEQARADLATIIEGGSVAGIMSRKVKDAPALSNSTSSGESTSVLGRVRKK